MPDLVEQMYCSQQIFIPPNLPSILKRFAKAAIRTQPNDLLQWSSSYFRAIVDGIPPPVKTRLEYSLRADPSGLSPGFLKVLINQVGKSGTINREILMERWTGVCLSPEKLEDMLKVGSFDEDVDWLKFVAIAAGTLERNLKETMILLCELLTEEPEGSSSRVPLDMFLELYTFLAKLDCGPDSHVEEVKEKVEEGKEENQELDEGVEFEIKEEEPPVQPKDWDKVVEEILEEKSEFTECTIDQPTDQSDVDGIVWPHIHPESESEKSGPSDKLAGSASDLGVQVFGPEEDDDVYSAILIGEAAEKAEEEQNEVTGEEDGGEGVGEAAPPAEEADAQASSAEGGAAKEESDKPEFSYVADVAQWNSSVLNLEDLLEEKGEEEKPEEEALEEEEEKEEKQVAVEEVVEEQSECLDEVIDSNDALSILSPDSSMNLIESPVDSQISFREKSLHDVAADSIISVGAELEATMPLFDVTIPRALREPPSEEEVEEEEEVKELFHKQIPGIGPVVPQEIIDQVELYMRTCAEKQCGTVMPRNIRHFTCPDLGVETMEENYNYEEVTTICNLKTN